MTSEVLIEGRKLVKEFSGVPVLRNVDIQLRGGEVHCLVGENGAGKSTLAKLLAGVIAPTSGEILLEGSKVDFAGPKQAMDRGIALIHQEPLTFSNLTVAENVFVGNMPSLPGGVAVSWSTIKKRASELFDSLGVRVNVNSPAGGLSVADQQMIELASALAHEAKVVIFDETTAALTPKEVEDLFAVISRLKGAGIAVVVVTHRLDEVFSISDRLTVLRDGLKVAEHLTAETTPAEIVSEMVGRELQDQQFGRANLQDTTPMLEVKSLCRPGEFKDISFELRRGEIVGLAGLVGAGRTEVCETIFGVRSPSSGQIYVNGRAQQIANPRKAIRLGLAMVPEDRQHHGLLLPFSVSQNTSLVVLARMFRSGWLNLGREYELSAKAAREIHLAYRGMDQAVNQLSGGNQQKVSLSKWLLSEPKVLILDEPTRGVDVGAKASIHQQIYDLARDKGLAILMVSSDLNEVLSLSDRILVMREGSLVAEFDRSSASASAVMASATGQVAIAS